MDYAKGVKGESDRRPRRFYTDVSVVADGPSWRITLDGRAPRTSAGNPLLLPTAALAELIAAEWRGQVERIDLHSMYITRLAYGALDRSEEAWSAVIEDAVRFAETDLVCYLADKPAALRAQQVVAWTPIREWAATRGIALEAFSGIIPRAQPSTSLQAVRAYASGLARFRLAGLAHAIPMLGSAILGMAVEQGRLTAVEAFDISRIDEAFQNTQWGEDSDAAKIAARARVETAALDQWFAALSRT